MGTLVLGALPPFSCMSSTVPPTWSSLLIIGALEGCSDIFVHYHPAEDRDAKDVAEYIKKVAPKTNVELYAKDLRDEKACNEMIDEIKKWSGGRVDIL